MPEPRTNVLRRWFDEVWNQGREAAIDELAAADVVAHGLFDSLGNEISGRDKFRVFWHQFRDAFPDVHVDVEDEMADGDKRIVRCKVRATHQGHGLGVAPTQKAVTFGGVVIARVKDGQLREVWETWDFVALYQQLGVIPASLV